MPGGRDLDPCGFAADRTRGSRQRSTGRQRGRQAIVCASLHKLPCRGGESVDRVLRDRTQMGHVGFGAVGLEAPFGPVGQRQGQVSAPGRICRAAGTGCRHAASSARLRSVWAFDSKQAGLTPVAHFADRRLQVRAGNASNAVVMLGEGPRLLGAGLPVREWRVTLAGSTVGLVRVPAFKFRARIGIARRAARPVLPEVGGERVDERVQLGRVGQGPGRTAGHPTPCCAWNRIAVHAQPSV